MVSKDSKAVMTLKLSIFVNESPGKVNHIRKVDKYPDVQHISYDEIKLKMFGLSLFPSK